VGEQFADVNFEQSASLWHWCGTVWAGISYGQQTQLHFIDGHLNAQRYREEILRPIVTPFICLHHLMFQHDNTQPHVAWICSQFMKDENAPVLPRSAYTPDMCLFGMLWIDIPTNIQQLRTAIIEEGTTFHSTQSTA
jgi:hypothetical protein